MAASASVAVSALVVVQKSPATLSDFELTTGERFYSNSPDKARDVMRMLLSSWLGVAA